MPGENSAAARARARAAALERALCRVAHLECGHVALRDRQVLRSPRGMLVCEHCSLSAGQTVRSAVVSRSSTGVWPTGDDEPLF